MTGFYPQESLNYPKNYHVHVGTWESPFELGKYLRARTTKTNNRTYQSGLGFLVTVQGGRLFFFVFLLVLFINGYSFYQSYQNCMVGPNPLVFCTCNV